MFGLHMRNVGDAVEFGSVNYHCGDSFVASRTASFVADNLETCLSPNDLHVGGRHVRKCGDHHGEKKLMCCVNTCMAFRVDRVHKPPNFLLLSQHS